MVKCGQYDRFLQSTAGRWLSDNMYLCRLMEVYSDYERAISDLKKSISLVHERYDKAFGIINGILKS